MSLRLPKTLQYSWHSLLGYWASCAVLKFPNSSMPHAACSCDPSQKIAAPEICFHLSKRMSSSVSIHQTYMHASQRKNSNCKVQSQRAVPIANCRLGFLLLSHASGKQVAMQMHKLFDTTRWLVSLVVHHARNSRGPQRMCSVP